MVVGAEVEGEGRQGEAERAEGAVQRGPGGDGVGVEGGQARVGGQGGGGVQGAEGGLQPLQVRVRGLGGGNALLLLAEHQIFIDSKNVLILEQLVACIEACMSYPKYQQPARDSHQSTGD